MQDGFVRSRRRDRWVSWLVIGVFLLALLLGSVVRVLAEGRSIAYEGAGIRARYPAGWVRVETRPPLLLQVEDRTAQPFRTRLMVERRPLPPRAPNPLGAVEQVLVLERGWLAYRPLEVVTETAAFGGNVPALHVTFAYVEPNSNPFLSTLPVVMLGEEYLLLVGDHAYVVTLTAAEANYPKAQRQFEAFLRSLQLQP
ncbi:MAG: hypothetical protein ACP5SI_06210 [Chloroflexia bacterium]